MQPKTLKELRKKHNLTQKELSQKLGMTKATYCHLENGNVRMSKITKLAIARVLDVDWKMIKDN